MLGGAWGSVDAFVPAVEAALAGVFDFYIEAEPCATTTSTRQLLLRLSEGLRPAEWLRSARRPARAYGGDRDIQRGPFAQLTWRASPWRLLVQGSKDQVFVASLGVAF